MASNCVCGKTSEGLYPLYRYYCNYCLCKQGVCAQYKIEGKTAYDTCGYGAFPCECTTDSECALVSCSRCSNNYKCQRSYWTNPHGVSCDTVTQPVTYSLDSTCTNLCSPGQTCQGSECVSNKYTCSSTGCVASASGSYTTSNCDGKCVKRCVGTSCQYSDDTSKTTCSNNSQCTTVSCSRCSNNYPCKKASWTNPPGISCDTVTQPVTYTTDDSCGGCPLDDYTGKCQCNGLYYEKEVAHYSCNNGSCSSGTEWLPYMKCDAPYYSSWSNPYCKDGDVYHKRTYQDRGCSSSSNTSCACYSKAPVIQEELITDCVSPKICINGVCVDQNKPSCSVIASASPNPISCGNNNTTISASGSGYTSCTGTGTFTQTSQTTYTVSCTGDVTHSDCSDGVTVANSACKYKCDASGNCVADSNGTYTTATCNNECPPSTHLDCNANKECVPVAGSGTDRCINSNGCLATNPHNECVNNNGVWQCQVISTLGISQCTNANQCKPKKYSCNKSTWTCIQDSNGSYSSSSDCEAACQAPSYDCYVGLSASPNPIPLGENRTKLCFGGASLNLNTCVLKRQSDGVTIPYTTEKNIAGQFVTCGWSTQIQLIETYTVKCNCVANAPPEGYVTASVTVTKGSPPTIPPTIPPPPTCQIISFKINDKNNEDQDPLIVWVNTLLRGYFSVNDSCKTCTVSSDDTWGNPPKTYPISTLKSSYTENFKIPNAGTYAYTLECVGTDPEDIVTDTLSLQTVKAMNLPWWREIIPNLLPFLRGMIR